MENGRRKRLSRMSVFAGIVLLCLAGGLCLFNLWDGKRAGEASARIIVALLGDGSALSEGVSGGQNEPGGAFGRDASGFGGSERGSSHTAYSGLDTSFPGRSGQGSSGQDSSALSDDWLPSGMNSLTADLAGTAYLGILSIPSANLILPVAADWNYTQLASSPCRFFGSLSEDNLVICGHNYASHFGPLLALPIGAEILLRSPDGRTARFFVSNRETLNPTEVERLLGRTADRDWQLTLVTCTPGGLARCALRCVRVS